MNKIFKTKYDVTTGQTKVVSELASNRQLASSSEKTPKCGGFLRMFKVLPLALLVSVVFSRVVYGASIWINNDTDNKWNGGRGIYSNYNTSIWYDGANKNIKDQHQELILLADKSNKAGAESDIKNEQAKYAVIIGSRAVGGGIGATSIGYKAIVGENTKGKNIDNANAQGTAVGYRTFARGAGATSLGNDTVAWGDSSIAIGSDGIGSADTKQKKLPKDIFRLFLNNAQNFNYTDEYPAVDFRFLLGISSDKKNEYVNGNGELVGKDGQNITKDRQYYIRKNGNEWNDFYIMREQYGEEVFYKKTSTNSNAFEEVVDPEEIKQIKQKNDYKQKKEYDEKVKSAYEKYLDETGANKKSQEAALKKKGNNVSYDNKRTHTWARGKNSIAVGARSIAYGDYTTAIGTFAIAFKDYSTAIGSDTIAFGKESLVLGNKSYVYADRTVGVGTNVQAINDGAMVYGSDSYAGGRGSLAIGNYALANIEMDEKFNKGGLEEGKEGFTFTDDKNREKYKANGKYQYDFEKFYELGNTKDIQENVQLIKPKTTKQDGTEELKAKQSRGSLGYNQGGIAIGSYSVALGDNTLTIGRYAYAKGDSAIAIGRFSFAKEKNAFAIGSFTRAIGEASIALGNNTYSGKQYSVAIGYKAQSHADKGIALGIEAGVGEKATGAMALGNEAEANLSNSVALGYKSTTNYFYDKNADASDKFTPKLSG
ncbi:adhesin, partial [Histophilus somni]